MTKIFVIAGNFEQANDWMKKDIKRRWEAGETSITLSHYIYVDSPTRVKGYLNPHGVFVGSWRERKDILDIAITLHVSSANNNPALMDIIRELRPTPKQFVGKGYVQVTGRQAIEQAADDLAKNIDQHLLEEFTRRINGGILSKSSQAIKDIYSD